MNLKKVLVVLGVAVAVSAGVLTYVTVTKQTWVDRQPELAAFLVSEFLSQGAPENQAKAYADCLSKDLAKAAALAKCSFEGDINLAMKECIMENTEVQVVLMSSSATCMAAIVGQ